MHSSLGNSLEKIVLSMSSHTPFTHRVNSEERLLISEEIDSHKALCWYWFTHICLFQKRSQLSQHKLILCLSKESKPAKTESEGWSPLSKATMLNCHITWFNLYFHCTTAVPGIKPSLTGICHKLSLSAETYRTDAITDTSYHIVVSNGIRTQPCREWCERTQYPMSPSEELHGVF